MCFLSLKRLVKYDLIEAVGFKLLNQELIEEAEL